MTTAVWHNGEFAIDTKFTEAAGHNPSGFHNFIAEKIVKLAKPIRHHSQSDFMIGALAFSGGGQGLVVINAIVSAFSNPNCSFSSLEQFFFTREGVGAADFNFSIFAIGVDGGEPRVIRYQENTEYVEFKTTRGDWPTEFEVGKLVRKLKTAAEVIEVAKVLNEGTDGYIRVYDPVKHKLYTSRPLSKARRAEIKELVMKQELDRLERRFNAPRPIAYHQ